MPVRSLSSSVLKWPPSSAVTRAADSWVRQLQKEGRIVRGGYFGSYARGDSGVGSDIDIVLVVAGDERPFEMRASRFDTTHLPVPADLLVYTENEWAGLIRSDSRFGRTMRDETVWID